MTEKKKSGMSEELRLQARLEATLEKSELPEESKVRALSQVLERKAPKLEVSAIVPIVQRDPQPRQG